MNILNKKGIEDIRIIDANSKTVQVIDFRNTNYEDYLPVDASQLLSGCYFVQIKYDNRITTKKLIITNF